MTGPEIHNHVDEQTEEPIIGKSPVAAQVDSLRHGARGTARLRRPRMPDGMMRVVGKKPSRRSIGMENPRALAGKAAIVTGASRGIGLAIAHSIGRLGA